MKKLNVVIDSVIKKDEVDVFCDGLGDCLRAVLRHQVQKNPDDGSVDVFNSLWEQYKISVENSRHPDPDIEQKIFCVVEKKEKCQNNK